MATQAMMAPTAPLPPGETCRRALCASVPEAALPSARTALALFRPELEEYAELISAPAVGLAGFMTKGEGAGFGERARAILIAGGVDSAAVHEASALAAWCDYRRAYFKVEWHPRHDLDGYDMVMASYFRRRPPLEAVQRYLRDQGMPFEATQQLGELAAALDKRTPHFVAVALRPGFDVHYKIYFTQYVTAETEPQVSARVRRALQLSSVSSACLARWEANHRASLSTWLSDSAQAASSTSAESTIFLSMSLTAAGAVPGIKIDYTDVPAAVVPGWAGGSGAAAAALAGAAQRAASAVGSPTLSFLGVRLLPERDEPVLKFYADLRSPPSQSSSTP
jgi:hypothetical protein